MKKYLSFVIFFLLITNIASSQCPYQGIQFGSANAPTAPTIEQTIATCIFGGEFERINGMEEGLVYRISTCGDTDFDTELTLFNAGGGAALDYNDDDCGAQSIIEYTIPADGNYDIQVNQATGCGTNTICMTVKLMLLTECRLECPDDFTVQTMNPAGATVNYIIDELPLTNNCNPVSDDPAEASGSLFPIGTHQVDLTDQTGGTVTCSFNVTVGLILPVEYSYFRGTPSSRGNFLEWATASEANNSHFVIQRSTDAWRWEDLNKLEGQGTSNVEQEYQFLDDNRPKVEEVYYRIMQVDFDGTENFTDIIALPGAENNPRVDVFPNPARTQFTLSLENFVIDENAEISLFNISDQLLLNKLVNSDGQMEIAIPKGTPAGMYVLKIKSADREIVKQIIIY